MDKFPTGPDDRGAAGAEKEPYTEAALDAELAKHVAAIRMDLEVALKERDTEKIGRASKHFRYVAESPIKSFLDFQNNFYGRLPGGLTRKMIEDLSKEVGEEPEMSLIFEDVDAVLKEIGADPGLVARAAGKGGILDSDASAFLRKVYIAMRNRGYTHQELRS